MRGILTRSRRSCQRRRISPAHAGNTGVLSGHQRGRGDQPRTCGEYPTGSRSRTRSRGSAPHMRGIPNPVVLLSRRAGISPAHAGNTRSAPSLGRGTLDQPRTCGEYALTRCAMLSTMGSAPHMRGIHRRLPRSPRGARISPAHAGNTEVVKAAAFVHVDQPRTCGEYSTITRERLTRGGSAPHMRGIPRSAAHAQPLTRISPAHAGNTSASNR